LIDIHCHILPGIDDGPKDVKTALKMAKIAVKDGVRLIIATPHCYDGVFDCQSLDIVALCAEFNELLNQQRINLMILPGAEIRLAPELVRLVDEGKTVALGGFVSTLLLELPEIFIPDVVENTIRILCRKGVRCIIAHPERNSLILSKNELVTGMVFAGAELQISGGSLLGDFGLKTKFLAQRFLRSDGRCYLASDGHNTKKRKPVLAKAVKNASKIIGSDAAKRLVAGFD
jgi:protein-tyrosine phosphatase